MSDVYCPYCGSGEEINHDDGYGYDEDEVHNQICTNCEKEFSYQTHLHFTYEAYKKQELNNF